MSTEVENWAKKYEDLTNGDETIKAMAKYYTCSFMLDMESEKVIVEMHDGKVKNINTKPSPLDPYDLLLELLQKLGVNLANLFQNQCITEYGLQVF